METVRLQILHASSGIAILFVIHFRGWSIFLTSSHYRVLPRMSSFLFFHNSPKHLLKFWQCLIVTQLIVAWRWKCLKLVFNQSVFILLTFFCVHCMDCLLIPCFMASWLPFVITQYMLPLAVNECDSVGLQCMHELNLSLISYHCLVLYILGTMDKPPYEPRK